MQQSHCAHCGQENPPSSRRPRKYCSKRCSMAVYREYAEVHGKRCVQDECDRPRVAHGLCSTHYNRTLGEKRHRKVEMPCGACGAMVLKDPSNAQRYTNVYCSLLCRDFHLHGPRSCPIPRDHVMNWMGKTCKWTPPLGERECGWCGTPFQPRSDAGRFCSGGCKKRQYKATRRGREAGAPGTYTWMDVTRLWRTFNGACAYCETPTPLDSIQAEHVHPISRGGANNISNLLPSCLQCNADKRDLTLDEWKHDRVRRGLPLVRTDWATDDERFAHLSAHSVLVAA